MSNPRRLIVCLDGTWNKEDDSTNVLHHYNLVVEGEVNVDGRVITQKKHYFRGIGTGPLDRITGGGFGFGLEQNVRDAYNWLVEHYEDGGAAPENADEIYIFGFSRGAYTARSLVGFIAAYGLLRRGAPLTVSQLWQNYCVLGRRREHRNGVWEQVFGEDENVPRQISTLVIDPWLVGRGPWGARRVATPNGRSEQLLIEWSRRAKITYLGIYETVGAIGWDALAIPGLKSKLALHHNMRPTTLIQKCRHALAIHEHRSSFQHTPFTAYLGDSQSKGEAARGRGSEGDPGMANAQCHRLQAMWNRKIKQRWFAGAHSNLGGGYADNLLAQRPLQWVLEGAAKAGLVCQTLPASPLPVFPDPPPRDSYAEFARPFWTMILRAKRNYRVIAPQPEHRVTPKDDADRNAAKAGFVLKHINERLDDSVFAYYGSAQAQPPPNLVEYARRKVADARGDYKTKLQALAQRVPVHWWPVGGGPGILAVILWAGVASVGLGVADRIFLFWWGDGPSRTVTLWVIYGLLAVDGGESRIGFTLALRGGGAGRRAVKDSIYWLRALGCVLFAFGALSLAGRALGFIRSLIAQWMGAAMASTTNAPNTLPEAMRVAGLLLLLQVGVAYFLKALSWVGEPMSNANLGSMVKLQLCATPAQVTACLDEWLRLLKCKADDFGREFKERALDPVRESLWRDLIGFIPLYTVVLGFGSWFAGMQLDWPWLAQWWFIFPAVAAFADYVEDFANLHFLSLYMEEKQPSMALTMVSFAMSLLKFAAFGIEAALTVTVIGVVSSRNFGGFEESGWRGLLASTITGLAVLSVVGIAIWAVIYRARNKPRTNVMTIPPKETNDEPAFA